MYTHTVNKVMVVDIHCIYPTLHGSMTVGCEWSHGARRLGGSHQGTHWYAANWIWQCFGRLNTV